MEYRATSPKITLRHQSLQAIVYVRQSTARQVNENKASADFQRSLGEMARQNGWSDDLIVVNDQDQGVSGTSTAGREGFKWLRQQIFDERVGAIICWDASRIARDSAALAQLINLCAATNTLIIDVKGVYDPNNENDRITLGLINVLVDAEGRRIAEKFETARRALAEKGELHLAPITGFVRNEEKKLVIDPDEAVQASLRLFFSKFEETESAYQVVKYHNRNNILFPLRSKNGRLTWGRLCNGRAVSILHNAVYAGAYVYGTSKTVLKMTDVESTERVKKRVRRKYDGDGVILIRDAHEGYITFEKFLENQQRLKQNRYLTGGESCGAPRNGAALLQGIAFCGKCLNKPLQVRYGGFGGKKQIIYTCNYERERFMMRTCLFTGAKNLDRTVADAFLEAINPARLRVTLEAFENIGEQARKDALRLEEAIKSAKTAVDKARERYESVSPRNRLVAEEYENKLEEKKAEVRRLEAERAKASGIESRRSSDAMRESLRTLTQDIRDVWDCKTVTNAERKRLLRLLIKRVTLRQERNGVNRELVIHWATGASTRHTYLDSRCMDPKAVELMRKLAPNHTVTQIINALHEAGFKPVRVERFDRRVVHYCFRAYGIALTCHERPRADHDALREDGRYPLQVVAKMLGTSRSTAYRMSIHGLLDTVQDTPRGARWIKISAEQVEELKRSGGSRRQGKS